MMEFINKTSLPLDKEKIASLVSLVTPEREVEISIIGSGEMRRINKRYRGIDKATDVLSFPLQDSEHLGSLLLCADKIKEAAQRYGHTIDDEAALLTLHGLLHLLGYDHETDQGEMRLLEEEWIKKLGLPASLIVRSDAR
ncbi:MAG: rRNA maturation RNase YbeY [Campylobacterales bacterium]